MLKLTAICVSLTTSVISLGTVFFLLERWDVLEDEYFKLDDARLLSTSLTSDQTLGLCILFAINAFLAQINHVLIEPIYRRQLLIHRDEIGDAKELNVAKHPWFAAALFMIYDIWKQGRSFLSILGIVSNFAFFVATLIGGFMGTMLVRPGYMMFPWVRSWMDQEMAYKVKSPPLERRRLIMSSAGL